MRLGAHCSLRCLPITLPAGSAADKGTAQGAVAWPSLHANETLAAHAGLLMARTVAIAGTFALAASLAASSDPAHAAAHQACLQVHFWGLAC